MGPGESLLKNAILLALGLTAALGFRARPAQGRGALPKAIAALVCAAGVASCSYGPIEPLPAPAPAQSGPFAQFVFEVDGKTINLGKGEHFVALLSSTCEHCIASVEHLNQLTSLPDFPRVVGLCEGEPESYKQFILVTAPQFSTHLIAIREFFSLIGQQPPRFVLVRDGQSIQTWDGEVPSPQQVSQARSEVPDAES